MVKAAANKTTPASVASFFTARPKQQDKRPIEIDVPETDAAELKKVKPVETGVLYSDLVHTYNKIEATTKRLEIVSLLTAFLLKVIQTSPDELRQTVYLCITKLAPDYEGIELGIGESLLLKAIAESTGRPMDKVKKDYGKLGDLGLVAAASRGVQPTMFKPKPLTITSVYDGLYKIANISGSSSQAKKIGIINKLLGACSAEEAKYLIRSLETKLRIGLAEKSVLTALSAAILSSQKRPTEDAIQKGDAILKQVYSELPTYNLIIPALLEHGLDRLREHCKLTPGVPLKPMLAKPTRSITEVLDRFEAVKFTCEYKYDGERGQIHLLPISKDAGADEKRSQTKIYSRNSENMSTKYPDIVSSIPRFVAEGTTSFVLDGEVVAWDVQQKKILPFQILATRKRKDVKEEDVKVKICYFAFDLLYLNGEALLHKSLRERRELLRGAFKEVDGEFIFAKAFDGETADEIQMFLEQSVKDSCEGLMVKLLDGPDSAYEPSKRSLSWLKVKKDYLNGVGDTLDLVVIGADIGKGKRTNWYGAFLLGCVANEGEEIQSIAKIGTGFSEEQLEMLHKLLKPSERASPPGHVVYDAGQKGAAEVWFEPSVVFEVLVSDLTLSPVYRAAAGIVNPVKGISLRFPRMLRVRDDKTVSECTTAEQVAEMYEAQAAAQQHMQEDED
ncbi:ATP-dependent DNA ligase [Protomyces lactucae-debilis]|uniref:DNA ligase n=1 Tax=Protomyces lactucae-debilis TaxID=2754530 RepID=A0A1Y2FXW1_PROLT|nr:ATP-dependent DNA ligase [Protomyces lactucae-debilis]ORY88006.1 ATP-dependent DNA ligase [Protomyces lactucae-debilis]